MLVEFKERPNSHQTHFEDLILLGRDGIEELNDKVDKFISQLGGGNKTLNQTVKIDGCLHPDTLVKTTEGDIPISKIIEDHPQKVYMGFGKDISTGTIKEVQLNFPRAKVGSKDWVELELDNLYTVLCTEDHPFMVVGKGFIPANDICLNDEIEEL